MFLSVTKNMFPWFSFFFFNYFKEQQQQKRETRSHKNIKILKHTLYKNSVQPHLLTVLSTVQGVG